MGPSDPMKLWTVKAKQAGNRIAGRDRSGKSYTRSTKLSTTFFSPAFSNAIGSVAVAPEWM